MACNVDTDPLRSRRLRYDRQQLLNFQMIINEDEQLEKWSQILNNLGPIAAELHGMEKKDGNWPKQTRKEKHQRTRKNKNTHAQDRTETIPGSMVLIQSEEQCYEEFRSEEQCDEDIKPELQCYEEIKPEEQCSEGISCPGLREVKAAEFLQSNNWLYEEEDFESSEDEFDSLQKPAFLVEGDPDFSSGPPQDGLEYLRRVRWEAAQCPRVKVANIDKQKLDEKQTPYMPNIPPILHCSKDLLPLKEWENEFLADFSNLRMALSKVKLLNGLQLASLPTRRDKAGWERFCFGASRRSSSDDEPCSQVGKNERAKDDIVKDLDLEIPGTTQECETIDTMKSGGKDPRYESYGEIKDATSPMLPVLLSLDEVARATLFIYHVSWLESISSLSKDRAVWLFALSAVLDKPLDADTSASVRALLRKCASLRAAKTKDDEELHMLNILITIAGKYFGQAEDLMSNSRAFNCTENEYGT